MACATSPPRIGTADREDGQRVEEKLMQDPVNFIDRLSA
jgi:hypothetical protein